jgi:hypothetical protein
VPGAGSLPAARGAQSVIVAQAQPGTIPPLGSLDRLLEGSTVAAGNGSARPAPALDRVFSAVLGAAAGSAGLGSSGAGYGGTNQDGLADTEGEALEALDQLFADGLGARDSAGQARWSA